jgi:aryl-alcohol dehydrogenase-like predicted oxidoreductase
VAPSQVVLAWLVARGWKPIIGVSSLEQLESALSSATLELSPEECALLEAEPL